MDLNTLRQTIIGSTQEDWHKITCWGAGSGPSYRYGFATARSDEHGVQTEAKDHGNIAILIEDVDISIAWGYDADETAFWSGRDTFDFSDFLPQFPDKSASRIYADVFYRGALVDRLLLVVADGGRYLVPIPRTTYPNQKSHDDYSQPQHQYTKWDIGFTRLVHSFEHGHSFDELLARMTYVVDDDQPIWSESK